MFLTLQPLWDDTPAVNNDELLTRGLLSAMASVVAWLAWVITGVVATPSMSGITTAVTSGGATIAVFFICQALRRYSGLPDQGEMVRALGAFIGFGVIAIVLHAADAPELVVRVLATTSQMGCGMLLGFRTRPVAGGLVLVAALSAIDTPFYGILLLSVPATAYLQRNPPRFLR